MKIVQTIAYKMIQEAYKNKANFVVLLLLNVFIVLLPIFLQTYDTAQGQIKLFLNYSLMFTGFVLYMCTLFFTSSSLANEIQHKQIYLIDVKPVPRYQFILGKFFGVACLNIIFLLCTSVVILGMFEILRSVDKTPEEQAKIQKKIINVYQEVHPFVDQNKLIQQVNREYRRLEAENRLPQQPEHEIKEAILQEITNLSLLVPVGMTKTWIFQDIPYQNLKKEDNLLLRYKLFTSEGNEFNIIRTEWQIGKGANRFFYTSETKIGEMVEFSVPTYVVQSNNQVEVRFTHKNFEDGMIYFPAKEGINLYYPIGSFYSNFFKIIISMFLMSCFISALCLFGCTFLNFPVAIFLTLVVLFLGLLSGIFQELVHMIKNLTPDQGIGKMIVVWLANFSLDLSLFLIPNFSYHVPLEKLFSGWYISWNLIIDNIVYIGLLRTVLFLGLACWIFQYREIGRPIHR